MAVPTSGVITLRGIRRELGTNNYLSLNTYSNISLFNMSVGEEGTINTANSAANRPNGSAPHSMSEWYAYDHDASSTKGFETSYSAKSAPCGTEMGDVYYHDGSGSLPLTGDNIYQDSAGEKGAPGGYYLTSNSGGIFVEDGRATETFGCKK